MQMYDIVATGVLGLLVGFWSGRSIRWKMEETEETGEDREERKNTAARQLVREGVTIGSPVNGEIRKRMEETAEETADAGTGCISIVPEDGKVYAPTAGKVLKLYPMGNRIRFRTDSGQRQGRTAQRLLSLQCPAKRDRAQRKTADGI